jgi:phosphate transport system substrate-binding protein
MSKTWIVATGLVGVVIAFAACGSSDNSVVRINGAGSTFAYPLYVKWSDGFAKLHPDVQIDYESIGSGAGIGLVTDGRVDFGGTDGPMTEEQLRTFSERRGCTPLHVPTALGAGVPAYNLPGVTAVLRFTPSALAGIFLGKITKWNDPELAAANSGVSLPDSAIAVVHRSDGSGTTYLWTDYLSKVSEEWKNKVGRSTSVNWPVGTSASGNQGVADLIKVTPNALGYLELTYAIRETLPYGVVQNSAGQFVKADFQSVTAAAAESAASMPADLRVSITNASGEHAYPIASFTWAIVPAVIADAAKRQALVAFLNWGLTDGQVYAESLSYARLPDGVIERAKELVAQIH